MADLEPALAYLQALDGKDTEIWETRYVLLLWLSLICMIPFDLKKVDSGDSARTLMDRLSKIGEIYLGSTGKEYESAAVLLTRLLTRYVFGLGNWVWTWLLSYLPSTCPRTSIDETWQGQT